MAERPQTMEVSTRGHRAHPHVADVILEAWGPGMAECFEEAAAALLGLCMDAAEASVTERWLATIGPGSDEDMLVELLDEILFVLDTADDVPIRVVIADREDVLDVVLELGDPASVTMIGSTPKAVAHTGLSVERAGGRVRCTVLVDV